MIMEVILKNFILKNFKFELFACVVTKINNHSAFSFTDELGDSSKPGFFISHSFALRERGLGSKCFLGDLSHIHHE